MRQYVQLKDKRMQALPKLSISIEQHDLLLDTNWLC